MVTSKKTAVKPAAKKPAAKPAAKNQSTKPERVNAGHVDDTVKMSGHIDSSMGGNHGNAG